MAQALAKKEGETVKKSSGEKPPVVSELEQSVKEEGKKREILRNFVNSQLKENVDYGSIKISGREGKPTLFKPGMEKIFSLFGIVSTLEKDEETLSMISAKDTIAYKCKLFRNGQFLSEGRGACSVTEKGRVNDAIKIAEKRARMDACLNLGFSEYFTQDLEDWKEDKPAAQAPAAAPAWQKTSKQTYATLEFTVEGKQELTAEQSGNPYARLSTDKGTVIAFRNTMDKFEVGQTYLVGGLWEDRNGSTAFLVTSPASAIKPALLSPQK